MESRVMPNSPSDGGWGCECSEFGALAPCGEGDCIVHTREQ
jgi:hypothetical protein